MCPSERIYHPGGDSPIREENGDPQDRGPADSYGPEWTAHTGFVKSRISVFDQVYADIGRRAEHRTEPKHFSSHMKNIVEILQESQEKTAWCCWMSWGQGQILPRAALAISIPENLKAWGARTIATTHYNELKNTLFPRRELKTAQWSLMCRP